MKPIINTPNLNDKTSMIKFLEEVYPEQKNNFNNFNFNNIILLVKQALMWFNPIHSNNFELTTPIKKREHQLNIIFGNKLSDKIAIYMRKNPKQVYKNYKQKKSIFGPHNNKLKNIDNLDNIMKLWKGIYNREQLKKYELAS